MYSKRSEYTGECQSCLVKKVDSELILQIGKQTNIRLWTVKRMNSRFIQTDRHADCRVN